MQNANSQVADMRNRHVQVFVWSLRRMTFNPDGQQRHDRLKAVPPRWFVVDRYSVPTREGLYCPQTFSRMSVGWYLDHSDTPNVAEDADGDFSALHDIAADEELTIDYDVLVGDGQGMCSHTSEISLSSSKRRRCLGVLLNPICASRAWSKRTRPKPGSRNAKNLLARVRQRRACDTDPVPVEPGRRCRERPSHRTCSIPPYDTLHCGRGC